MGGGNENESAGIVELMIGDEGRMGWKEGEREGNGGRVGAREGKGGRVWETRRERKGGREGTGVKCGGNLSESE